MRVKSIKTLCAVLLAISISRIQAEDYKFTALFIFNFAKYVEWPSEGGDLVIGILGSDPVISELEVIAEKTKIGDRPIIVKKYASAEKVEKGHIIYVTPGQSDALQDISTRFGAEGVLIVTNKKGLAEAGAAINLATIDGKQRYEINIASLKKSGLKVLPVLFKLGKVIS